MTLDPDDQEIAETLLRHHKAQKQVNCSRRRLCRTAESLEALSKAITSELEGKQDHLVMKHTQAQVFSVAPANQTMGKPDTYELPNTDDLVTLLETYRAACKALDASKMEVNEL